MKSIHTLLKNYKIVRVRDGDFNITHSTVKYKENVIRIFRTNEGDPDKLSKKFIIEQLRIEFTAQEVKTARDKRLLKEGLDFLSKQEELLEKVQIQIQR